ncbi:CAP domain-containing protein [Peribacillus sp. SCS-155]|uniref:CAP domain-containing protein n=1 Tax=Peribacillus sedimenti TaxID=3115297 RepID=UPI003906C964
MGAVFFIIGIYFNIGQEGGNRGILIGDQGTKQKNTDDPARKTSSDSSSPEGFPREGIGSFLGKSITSATKLYGSPARVDLSAFGYEWWIYNQDKNQYFQLAVLDGKVVSAYAIGKDANIYPFKIGQSIDEIYSRLYIETYVDIDTKESSYRFELSEEDMNMRPLIKLGSVYAQVYLDKFTGTISSVRFLDKATLVKQRPYELTYRGKLSEEVPLSVQEWAKIEEGNKRQIFDITNIIRSRFDIPELEWDEQTARVAYLHSQDMSEASYFSHTSPTKGELSDRLKEGEVSYVEAGENIAAKYVDAAAAMEGWLNSESHRETMLNEDFTHLGVGVYRNFYTQNFIESDGQ